MQRANGAARALRALPGLRGTPLPGAAVLLTGLALQPGLRALGHIAREEIAAGLAVLRIGRRYRRDGATRAGRGILPLLARILLAAAQHFARRRLGESEIAPRGHCARPALKAR